MRAKRDNVSVKFCTVSRRVAGVHCPILAIQFPIWYIWWFYCGVAAWLMAHMVRRHNNGLFSLASRSLPSALTFTFEQCQNGKGSLTATPVCPPVPNSWQGWYHKLCGTTDLVSWKEKCMRTGLWSPLGMFNPKQNWTPLISEPGLSFVVATRNRSSSLLQHTQLSQAKPFAESFTMLLLHWL